MIHPFEDHCWRDVVDDESLTIYAKHIRDVYVGRRPALLAIDLYNRVYEGGDRPVRELIGRFPSACGEQAWRAIAPTKALFAACRKAGIPVVYSTGAPEGPTKLRKRTWASESTDLDPYGIRHDFEPMPGDRVIYKERASTFHGTPLDAYLRERRVESLIVCGESTSGCVRASVVEAVALGFHVTVAEECCFDRMMISHKINLYDMHHKYADVMHVDEIIAHLDGLNG
ncbi:MAG TPA: isochorismatase family protein [Beijerinckiaceae bacterium]|jgi:nicotinamidase-related amidase|nr:isochorismatase family protein [Beijerinckiaceae bacterium]